MMSIIRKCQHNIILLSILRPRQKLIFSVNYSKTLVLEFFINFIIVLKKLETSFKALSFFFIIKMK